jgi:methylmalonyl-CoA mutase
MTELSSAKEFKHRSYDDWRALVDAALKGASFDKKLVSRTSDGIDVEPLYTPANAFASLSALHAPAPWLVAQAVCDPDPSAANAAIHREVDGGATSIVLRVTADGHDDGVRIASLDDLDATLANIDVCAIPIRLDARADGLGIAAMMDALLERRGIAPDASKCALGIDPFAAMIDGATRNAEPGKLIATAADAAGAGYLAPVMVVDGHRLHAAGASEAQELAGVLAMGVAVLRGAEAAGHDLDAAQTMVRFVFATDADIFTTIAKLRAWPLLWSRIIEASGGGYMPSRVSAQTASRMLAQRDPAVNMLRATSAVFAAAVAGAGEITVTPHTGALELPDGLACRIARNTQVILQEESNIARVGDPAAGSWYADTLTCTLAATAWDLFRDIDRRGGFTDAFGQGFIQEKIAATHLQRQRELATRKQPLTGVSEFPNIAEAAIATQSPGAKETPPAETIQVANWNGAVEAVRMGKLPIATGQSDSQGGALPQITLASDYEDLRARSDVLLAKNGARPQVFLATVGHPSDYTARASWARNLFEAGGIEAGTAGDAADSTDIAKAFKASGAGISCICSSDALYDAHGADAASALAAAGAAKVYLAGRPSESLEAAGIDQFVHVGCDIVEILDAALTLFEQQSRS